MEKAITMPKVIYDNMMKDVKAGYSSYINHIAHITDPYNGQLGYDDINVLRMYKNGVWVQVKLPGAINPAGVCKFGDFKTYYLYWINYQHPEHFGGSYMLTTVPFEVIDSRLVAGTDDDKIHDVICEFATRVARANETIVFTETASEACMQAVIKSEQYKYAMIEAVVKQFENVSVEFVPQDTEEVNKK